MRDRSGLPGASGIASAKADLQQRFGRDRVVEIQVHNNGDLTAASWLPEKLKAMIDPGAEPNVHVSDQGLTVRAVVAPVSDLAAFRARIDFGDVVATDEAQRLVVVSLSRPGLPGSVPGLGPGGRGGPDDPGLGPRGPFGPFGPDSPFGPRGPGGRRIGPPTPRTPPTMPPTRQGPGLSPGFP